MTPQNGHSKDLQPTRATSKINSLKAQLNLELIKFKKVKIGTQISFIYRVEDMDNNPGIRLLIILLITNSTF